MDQAVSPGVSPPEFVAVRLEPLRRTAYLLCRDWHTADDLVSITIGKLYRHWRRPTAGLGHCR